MKIFIDVAKKLILKTDTENRTLFKGEDAADVIKVYFEATPTNWYLTLGALLPNGRTISDRFHDGPIGAETINGTRYYYEEFTITKANGWNLCNGKVSFTLKLHETNANGDNVATKVIGTFVATIVDAVVTNENILILDGDTAEIVANMQQQIESIRALVTAYRNTMTAVNLTVTDTATIPNIEGNVSVDGKVSAESVSVYEIDTAELLVGDMAEVNSLKVGAVTSNLNPDENGSRNIGSSNNKWNQVNAYTGNFNQVITPLVDASMTRSSTVEASRQLKIDGLDIKPYVENTRSLIEAYKNEHTAQYNDLVNELERINSVLEVDNPDLDTLKEIIAMINDKDAELLNWISDKVSYQRFYSAYNELNSAIAQNKLTAGNGIKIESGVISIDIPNGDEVAY